MCMWECVFFLFLFLFRVILFSFFSWSLVFLVSSLSCIYFFSLYTAVKSPLPLLFLCIGIISLEILSSYGKLLWFGSDFCSCSLYFTNLYIYIFFYGRINNVINFLTISSSRYLKAIILYFSAVDLYIL